MGYCVYKHTFPNGKVYIGITCKKPEQRWGKDGKGYLEQKDGKYNQPLMANAVLKYGWNNVAHEILFDNLNREEAEQIEINLIAQHKSNNPEFGYNIAIGGGIPHSRLRQVICIETGEIFDSYSEAEKETGIGAHGISDVCKGLAKTAGKKHWKFVEDVAIATCIDCGKTFIKNNIRSYRQVRCKECQFLAKRASEKKRRERYKASHIDGVHQTKTKIKKRKVKRKGEIIREKNGKQELMPKKRRVKRKVVM